MTHDLSIKFVWFSFFLQFEATPNKKNFSTFLFWLIIVIDCRRSWIWTGVKFSMGIHEVVRVAVIIRKWWLIANLIIKVDGKFGRLEWERGVNKRRTPPSETADFEFIKKADYIVHYEFDSNLVWLEAELHLQDF